MWWFTKKDSKIVASVEMDLSEAITSFAGNPNKWSAEVAVLLIKKLADELWQIHKEELLRSINTKELAKCLSPYVVNRLLEQQTESR